MSKIGNYVVGREEELDLITSEWQRCFNEARAIRKEIAELNKRLVETNNEFEKIDRIWVIYEKATEAGL
tara:strand:+ start:235 stop:441 length:207 start_codon:yes stop_codon:yes gene_type:complete